MFFANATQKIIFTSLVLSMGICNISNASCCSSPHIWGSAEYLYWWTEDSPVSVPLITQNNNPSAFGFINEPGTQIIFGSGSSRNAFKLGGINGGRLTIGGWIDDESRYGMEGSIFGSSQAKDSFRASSVGGKVPILNIPFFSTQSAKENVLVNRLPNTASVSDTFQPFGLEVNSLYRLQNGMPFPLIFLMGFRYIKVTEDFTLNDAVFNNPSIPNAVLNVNDNFSTKNNFYGIQVGARSNFVYCQLMGEVTAKVALGENYQRLIISGQTNLNNRTILQRIGLFAEPSNIGTFKHNQLAVVSEVQAKIGYNLNQHVRPFITYNCIYMNNILRPGKQIDRNINLSQNRLIGGTGILSGSAAPSATFNGTGMWMQGVSVGIEVSF